MLRYISRISRHARPHPRILRYVASEAHGSGGGGRGGGGGGGGGGWGHDDEHHDDRHDENHTRRWLLAVLPILAGLTTASTAHAKKFSVFTSSPPNAPSLSPADERALGDLRHALNAFWADALADASLDDQRSAAQQRASSSASSGTAGPLSPATRALLLASLEVSATTDGIEVTCAVAPSFEKTASAALRRLASSLCEQVTSSWTSGRNLAVTGHRRGESGPLTMSLSPPTDRTPTSKDGDGTGIDRAWRIRITLPLSILQSPLLTTGTLAERLTGVLEAAAGLESREGADAMSQISDAEWLASVMGRFGLPFLPGFGAMDGTGIPGMNGMSDQDGGDAPGWGDIFGMSPPSTSYSSYTSSYGSGVDGIGDGGSGTATNTNMRARARAPTPAERQAALTRATAEELRRMGMDVVLPPAMAGEEDALDTEETSNSRKGRGKGKGLGKGSGSDPSRYVDWEGVQGYQAQKSAIETSVLLALRHQDVYRQVLQATRRDGDSTPLPRAVLLTGPPGCGKTLMARKVAREAGVPMVHVPSESVASKWYGQSEKQLANVFKAAERFGEQGCVIFLDEVDSLAGARGAGDQHEATKRMLGVLLRHLDGFSPASKTVVLAATNRPEDLDPALRSRFALTVPFPLPSEQERASILAEYARHLPESGREVLAKGSPGMSGRDLRAVCEDAERRWAAGIVQGSHARGSTPALDAYLAALRRRRGEVVGGGPASGG